MKDDTKSNLLKISGNDNFSKKKFREALVDYNQSLCKAETNFQKSLLYGNRSAVYFEMKKYSMCLENIELAKHHNYPEDKLVKLNEREEKCRHFINSENTKNDSISQFFKLSQKSHKSIPFIIDGIEVKLSDKFGLYLITNKDLKTGDIIAIEEPFIKLLNTEFYYERCANCLNHNFLNLIPCQNCDEVMYCSEECKINFESNSHKFTCSSKMSIPVIEITMKMTLKAIKEYGNFQNLLELHKTSKRFSLFDFQEMNDKNKAAVVSSLTMSDNSKISITDGMKKTFDFPPFNEFWTTIDERDNIIDLFHRNLRILNTNLLELGEHHYQNGQWYAKSVGSGLFPFASMFNHNCDPNVNRVTLNNQLVFYVARPIKAGEQLFISYGYFFSRIDKDERSKGLSKYSFECDCEACKKNLPLLEKLPRKTKRFLEPSFDAFEPVKAIEQFRKNCIFIEKNIKIHPCYETAILILHNIHLMNQIARLRI